MVPTEAFRLRQIRELPRAGSVSAETSDLRRAQHDRLERDRLVCQDAADSARRLGIEVISVDGTADAGSVADRVMAAFAPFLG